MTSPAQPFRLILASASPRRRELLAQAGFAFEVEAADVDESLHPAEAAGDYVRRLAQEKAAVVLARHRHSTYGDALVPNVPYESKPILVLGADTTVVCDGEILAKPADAGDARRMLQKLSGRVHQVLTGIAIAAPTGVRSAIETTSVTFAEIPESELAAYCATPEPLDKAGAYGIQGYAARWIPRIDGCYFNVMGLPISRVVALIAAAANSARTRAIVSR